MNLVRTIVTCAALSAAVLPSRRALAGEPDPAALFDRGVADMEAGRLDAACPAIEQSYKLDPLPGTLFTLAECESKRGRIATALVHYNDYLAAYGALSRERRAKQGDREKVARAQKAALGADVPELTLALPPNAPDGTTVTRDGVAVEKPDLGVPIRVDPGEHVIVTRAPGRPASTVRVSLAARERKGIALVIADPAAPFVPPPAEASPPNVRLIVGITALSIGAAFVVTGIVGGAEVNSVNNNSEYIAYQMSKGAGATGICDNPPAGDISSLCAKQNTSFKLELASFPLAAVFAGVGIFLVATNRPTSTPTPPVVLVPNVGPHFAGLRATLPF